MIGKRQKKYQVKLKKRYAEMLKVFENDPHVDWSYTKFRESIRKLGTSADKKNENHRE